MTYQQQMPPQGYYPAGGSSARSKGLGIAAMVVGIAAVVFSFIPIVGILSLALGPTAIVLGLIAALNRRGTAQGWTGVATGSAAVVFAVAGPIIFSFAADDDGAQGAEQDFEEIQEEYAQEVEAQDSDVDAVAEDDEDFEVDAENNTFDLGETLAIVASSDDDELYTITMNEVIPSFQCTADYGALSAEANSGAFLGLDLSISASDAADGSLTVRDSDFYVIDNTGEITDFRRQPLDAYMCLNNTDELQEARPGTNSTGLIVFDSAVESGTLVYEGGPAEIRWEF